jgi:hypothetical protein
VLTENATVYRSADHGFSGSKLSDHFDKLAKKELEGTDAAVYSLLINIITRLDLSQEWSKALWTQV